MNQKCVFLDIDHTLIDNSSDTIPDSALLAINKAKANNHLIFICSGRPYPCIDDRIISLPVDGFVASVGADVRCDGRIIKKRTIPYDIAFETIGMFIKNHVSFKIDCLNSSHAFLGGQDFVINENKYHLQGLKDIEKIKYLNKHQIYFNNSLEELKENDVKDYLKFTIFSKKKYFLESIVSKLNDEFRYYISQFPNGGYFGEITYQDTNKAMGINDIVEYLNIRIEDTISIGDSVNDIDMIKFTNVGIAMGNGCEQLKSIADYITTDVDKDGIYNAFKHLKLID